MKTISVFDTSILSYNIGNEIIMDAVLRHLNSIFPSDFIVRLPIEDIGTVSRRYNRLSSLTYVGGTNALNGDLRKYHQWDLNLHNVLILKNIVLMGCGWFQYESIPTTRYTKWAFNRVLAPGLLHSVRDNYTLMKCQSLNLPDKTFINTGCPTLWELTPSHLSKIPQQKSDKVVFTITDYNKLPVRDVSMIDILRQNYRRVYLFPQGTGDINYLDSLNFLEGIDILSPRLEEFDNILKNGADYVGTRLHAGVRALQKGCRSFIIGIDNRALEMKNDFNIPVINQDELRELDAEINGDYKLVLSLPWDNINQWKNQFKDV